MSGPRQSRYLNHLQSTLTSPLLDRSTVGQVYHRQDEVSLLTVLISIVVNDRDRWHHHGKMFTRITIDTFDDTPMTGRTQQQDLFVWLTDTVGSLVVYRVTSLEYEDMILQMITDSILRQNPTSCREERRTQHKLQNNTGPCMEDIDEEIRSYQLTFHPVMIVSYDTFMMTEVSFVSVLVLLYQ